MNNTTLKTQIEIANKAYRTGTPIISDHEYDELLEQYSKTVSSVEFDNFRSTLHELAGKVKHPFILGSLNKLKTDEPKGIYDFISKYVKNKLSVSAKVDGISCRLHYENGILISASTRGDGHFGIDITDKINYIINVPKTISTKNSYDIRGELVIFKSLFDTLSHEFQNPRNAVAGIMNRKEYTPEQLRCVSFVAYTVLGEELTKSEQLQWLTNHGFYVAWNKLITVSDNIVDELFGYATKSLDYEIDGVVISDETYRNENEYHPKAQAAVKTNTLASTTKLIDVEFDGPSKNGFFTPIAILEPLELGGVVVSRATLHNLDFINEHNLTYGCTLSIVRSGDVIPKVLGVVGNTTCSKTIELPTTCSCCDSELIRDGVNLRCINPDCIAQKMLQLTNFIKKLGVKSSHTKTLENFGITDYSKLCNFTANSKYKMQVKLQDELQTKMFTRSAIDLFSLLDIKDLSENLQKKIIDFYGWEFVSDKTKTYNDFIKRGYPLGIGDVTLEKFCYSRIQNLEIVELITSHPRYNYINIQTSTSKSAKNGMSICFTGKLNTLSRADATVLAESAGFEVLSGVNKKLTYLVTNTPNSGSSKNKKALEFGTKVITENEFLTLINNNTLECDVFEL